MIHDDDIHGNDDVATEIRTARTCITTTTRKKETTTMTMTTTVTIPVGLTGKQQ